MADQQPVAWDTSILSRAAPGTPRAERALAEAASGRPIAIPSLAWAEYRKGLHNAVRLGSASNALSYHQAWWAERVRDGDALILPLDRTAADLVGFLLGQRPKANASWQCDVMIAATAWSAGYAIGTDNRRDFDEIVALLGSPHELPVVTVAR